MHLTLKKETTKPPAFNFLQQQEKFDDFIEIFNHQRPHQSIGMKYPGELYTPSSRIYQGLPDINYPFHDNTITVTNCGRLCIGKKKINFSTVFAAQNVGITEIDERIWLLSFMQFDLGYFDEDSCRVEPLRGPLQG
jgi:putative transposase